MSLNGTDPVYLYGAMMNAQLASVIYLGWTHRFYISNQPQLALPETFTHREKQLGAQFIKTEYGALPSPLWRYLVMFDPLGKYLLFHEADSHRALWC